MRSFHLQREKGMGKPSNSNLKSEVLLEKFSFVWGEEGWVDGSKPSNTKV